MINHYETLFVVKPTLTEEEIKSQVEKVKAILEKEGAELIAADDMGMRKLAYPVQKNSRGYYTVLLFKTEGDTISELERNLRINEEVIKFLTVKYSKSKEIIQFNRLVAAVNKKNQLVEPVKTEAPVVETPAVEAPAAEAPAATEAVETTEAPTTTEA